MSTVFPVTEWVWADGEVVPWRDATLHVMSHVVHYGSSVFEGIRAYASGQGPMYFRYPEHMRRLRESASIYRMQYAWTDDELRAATSDLIALNGLDNAYIRPVVLRGLGAAGVDPEASPVQVFIAVWSWGAYLGPEALEKGVDAGVASWFRPAPNTHPNMAKAGGNYLNGQLMKMEAKRHGYEEAIALSVDGLVSEGSGQNIFLVKDGTLHTPLVDASFLHGITRDSILALAEDLGIPVKQAPIPREQLYIADEIFFCGTASEITPVRSVDHWKIGAGMCGPVTARLQQRFLAIVSGEYPDRHGWLSRAEPSVGGVARPAEARAGVSV